MRSFSSARLVIEHLDCRTCVFDIILMAAYLPVFACRAMRTTPVRVVSPGMPLLQQIKDVTHSSLSYSPSNFPFPNHTGVIRLTLSHLWRSDRT